MPAIHFSALSNFFSQGSSDSISSLMKPIMSAFTVCHNVSKSFGTEFNRGNLSHLKLAIDTLSIASRPIEPISGTCKTGKFGCAFASTASHSGIRPFIIFWILACSLCSFSSASACLFASFSHVLSAPCISSWLLCSVASCSLPCLSNCTCVIFSLFFAATIFPSTIDSPVVHIVNLWDLVFIACVANSSA